MADLKSWPTKQTQSTNGLLHLAEAYAVIVSAEVTAELVED